MAELCAVFTDMRFLRILGSVLGGMVCLYAFLYLLVDAYNERGVRNKQTKCASGCEWWMYAVLVLPQTDVGVSVSLPLAALFTAACVLLVGIYLIYKAIVMNQKLTLYTNPRKTLLSFKKTADDDLKKEGIQKIADCFGGPVPRALSDISQIDRLIYIITLTREHSLGDHREFIIMLYRIAEYQNDVLLASTLDAAYRIKK
jgi:hypothetical protein